MKGVAVSFLLSAQFPALLLFLLFPRHINAPHLAGFAHPPLFWTVAVKEKGGGQNSQQAQNKITDQMPDIDGYDFSGRFLRRGFCLWRVLL